MAVRRGHLGPKSVDLDLGLRLAEAMVMPAMLDVALAERDVEWHFGAVHDSAHASPGLPMWMPQGGLL